VDGAEVGVKVERAAEGLEVDGAEVGPLVGADVGPVLGSWLRVGLTEGVPLG